MALPEDPAAAPVLFGQVSIDLPAAHSPEPVVSIDVTVSEVALVQGESMQSSAWAPPISTRPRPIELRSMTSVGGGQTAFAGFRPQLGPGLVFAGREVLDSMLHHSRQQVLPRAAASAVHVRSCVMRCFCFGACMLCYQ